MENVDIFYTKRGILFRGGLDGFWFAVLSPFFFLFTIYTPSIIKRYFFNIGLKKSNSAVF